MGQSWQTSLERASARYGIVSSTFRCCNLWDNWRGFRSVQTHSLWVQMDTPTRSISWTAAPWRSCGPLFVVDLCEFGWCHAHNYFRGFLSLGNRRDWGKAETKGLPTHEAVWSQMCSLSPAPWVSSIPRSQWEPHAEGCHLARAAEGCIADLLKGLIWQYCCNWGPVLWELSFWKSVMIYC